MSKEQEVITEALKMALDGQWEAANKLIMKDTARIEDKISNLTKAAEFLKEFIKDDIEMENVKL